MVDVDLSSLGVFRSESAPERAEKSVSQIRVDVILLQKLLDAVALLEIVEEHVDRDPCSAKDGRAAKFFWIDFDIVVGDRGLPGFFGPKMKDCNRG